MSSHDVVESLGVLLENVLDGVASTFDLANVVLPEKQYIATGEVAHDCEQVTVSLIQMYLGAPGSQSEEPQRCNVPRSAVLQIQIARCLPPAAPRSTGPSVAAMTEMTKIQARDSWLLMDAALSAVDDYAGVLADVSVTNPAGGFQAVVLNLTVAVP